MSAGWLKRSEDGVAALVAGVVITLPLAEIAARTIAGTGIRGAAPFTQNLTLWLGMLGAAIAARDEKLLALATGTFLPEGRLRAGARIIAATTATFITALFVLGSVGLVRSELAFPGEIAVGVQRWVAMLVLPIAFGLIGLRIAWWASTMLWGRAMALGGAALGLWIGARPVLEGDAAWPWVALLLVGALVGAPIFVLLGGIAMVLFLAQGAQPVVPLVHAYAQLTHPTLPAIPLFTIAGYLLAEGGASARLLRLFRAFFGWMPGGTAIVTAALCAFFTTFTGGSGVTILALGGLLLPALLADRYGEKFSIGLITSAGSLGLLFPPAVPLILYGIVAANVDMADLFVGALLPGVVMLTLLAALGVREGLRRGAPRTSFTTAEAAGALWSAKWEVLLPIVVLISLLGGYATPTESAAVAALGALVVQRFVHRDLATWGAVVRVMGDAVALVGGVLIILAVAVGLTNYMVDAQVPMMLVEWAQANITSQAAFLLGLNVFLLIVGCLMDIFSAIIVVVPLIVPLATVFGVHPVHLGVIFIANLELGYLTPPVGLNLFLASYRFNRPLLEVARASLPMLIVLAIGVLLISYVPVLTLGLLQLLGRG